MNKGLVIGLAAVLGVLIVGGGVWYASQSREKEASAATEDGVSAGMPVVGTTGMEEKVVVTDEGTMTEGKVREFVVEGSEFKFNLAEIRVKSGETVRVVFKNAGKMLHDFVIDEFELATNQIGSGEEEEVEFTPDRAGTFEYYCSVGKHRQMGMVGKLIVE